MTTPEQALAEAGAARQRALDAYLARDLEGYMDLFARDLKYTDANGRTVDWEQFRREARAEWTVVRAPQTTWRRESWSMQGDRLVEVIEQDLSAIRHTWFIFKMAVKGRRRAAYDWRFADGKWRIAEARILEEERTAGPLELGCTLAGSIMLGILGLIAFGVYLLLR